MRDIDTRLGFMVTTAILLVIFGMSNAWFAPVEESGSPDWYRAPVIAVLEAARQETEPKLILAGGSNVIYGFRSEVISTKTGMPVVNAGISSMMLSITSYTDVLAAIVKPGDIVIFSAAELTVPDKPPGLAVSRRRAEALTASLGIPFTASSARAPKVWQLIPERALATRLVPAGPVGRDQTARRFGNEQTCVEAPMWRTPKARPVQPPPPETIAATHRLAQVVRARGGTIYFSLPWILVRAQDLDKWEVYNLQLIAALEEIAPVIDKTSGHSLQTRAELFCNGPTHLLEPASRLRSRMLAETILSLPNSESAESNRLGR